jgi:hypothetical protein
LAAALDEYHGSFSAVDGPWITQTVGQLVRLANRVSPSNGIEFTAHCESLLATAGQGRSPSAALSARPDTIIVAPNRVPSKPRSDSPLPAKHDADQIVDITPLREFAASPAAESALSAPPATVYQRLTAAGSAPAGPQVDHQTAGRPAPIDQSDAKAGWMLHSSGNVKSRSTQESLDAAASSAGAKKAASLPPADDELKAADSRSLLKHWLEANNGSRPPLERELARRGLGKLNAKLVQVLFSDRVEDRVRLVQEIVNSPGVNSKAWLSMLTDDPDADVRLAAVTFMATSTDPQLADQAYQAAIHDRDPRVANLAGRLRERRDSVQRR